MSLSFEEPLISKTPLSWGRNVVNKLDHLLSDHAACERKAAAFGLGLLQRYGHFYKDQALISKLVREEMRHYELVLKIINVKHLKLIRTTTSAYAKNLRATLQDDEPIRHIQHLLVAAIIEARSCERFEVLSQCLKGIDDKLAVFYNKLALAEKRHHLLYIDLARALTDDSLVMQLLSEISNKEHFWLQNNKFSYRMHSGLASA